MKSKMAAVLACGGLLLLAAGLSAPAAGEPSSEDLIRGAMARINASLASLGKSVRVDMVEYYTASAEPGQIVYFNNRTHQLSSDWVSGDPNRDGRTNITWLSDVSGTEGIANPLTLAQTQGAVDRAMATWNSVACSTIPLEKLSDYGLDWGYVEFATGWGGMPAWYADVTQAGWMPAAFFQALGFPANVIGVTYTFIWVDENGDPTDMDNNRRSDVAFRETYYNNLFPWGIDTNYPIDVETIVLHENGHSLSLGHFGKLIRTEANGMLHFAPLAVMNAGYTQVQQKLAGTDLASFCAVWGKWPNR